MVDGPRYTVGQVVRFIPGTHERAYGGLFTVTARLPEERGERQYRVKSSKDNHERIVRESQISAPAHGASEEAAEVEPKAGASHLLNGKERASLRRLALGAAAVTIPIGHLARFRHLGLTKPMSGGEMVTEKGKKEAGRRAVATE